ncbi:MAG: hypothetical protein WD045_07410, partial [Pirellulaceae bacterium]
MDALLAKIPTDGEIERAAALGYNRGTHIVPICKQGSQASMESPATEPLVRLMGVDRTFTSGEVKVPV